MNWIKGNKKLIGIIVSILILTVISFNINFGTVFEALTNLTFTVVLFAFLLNITGSVVLNSLQIYQHVQRHSKQVVKVKLFFALLKIDFIIRFYSLVAPTAVTAGIRWHMFNKMGLNTMLSALAVIINKFLNLLFILMFSFMALIYSRELFEFKYELELYVLLLILICIVATVIVVIINGKILSVLSELGHWLYRRRIKFLKKISKKILRSSLQHKRQLINERSSFMDVIFLLLWPFCSFILVAYSQLLIMNSMGLELTIIEALFVRSAVLLAMMLPFSFAGIGLREVGVIGVLSLYGASFEDAMAVSLVLFVFQLAISFIGFLATFKSADSALNRR